MREPIDTKTADLLPSHDLAGERPAVTSYGKQRLDKMRAAKGLKGLTVNLPVELVDEFHTKRKARGHSANQAIETLLRTQYLRKR